MKVFLTVVFILIVAASLFVVNTVDYDESIDDDGDNSINSSNTSCYLCEGSGEVLNEDLLIETSYSKNDVITCKQLASELRIFEQDSDRCYANQNEYAIACCTDQNEHVVELILSDDVNLDEFVIEENYDDDDDEFSYLSRVSRFLWAVKSSWNKKSSSGWSKPKTSTGWNKPKTSNTGSKWSKPKTTSTSSRWNRPTSTGSSYNSVWSKPKTKSSSYSSGKCNLCYDRAPPSKTFQGVVVKHYSMKYSGSCKGLDNKLKTMSRTHQMCKVTQAKFQRTCGC